MDNFKNCTVKNVNEIDDGFSDAGTIALALTNYCIIEYAETVNAYNLSNNKNKEDETYSNTAYSKEGKIKASINTVLKYRHDKPSTTRL